MVVVKASLISPPQQQQQKPKPSTKKIFLAYQTGKRHPHTHAAAVSAFAEYCQATMTQGQDIAASIRQGSRIDLAQYKPTLEASKKATGNNPTPKQQAEADLENKQFEIDYRIKSTAWHKREKDLENNEPTAYSKF